MESSVPPRRVVLITGAAGGLGTELVNEFVTQGWQVIAASHHTPFATGPETVFPVQLDVTNQSRCEEISREISARWGRLDVLINNAGTTADHASWQITPDEWDRVLAVNLKGSFLCARAVLPTMLRQRDGHIINIASFAGRCGARGQAHYAAAKAGLFGLTSALAREVGSRNIRVNAILPGVLPTAMTAGLSQDQLDAFAKGNALGRINSVLEVARFIVFLAAMQNVSGQLFQLDSRIGPWS